MPLIRRFCHLFCHSQCYSSRHLSSQSCLHSLLHSACQSLPSFVKSFIQSFCNSMQLLLLLEAGSSKQQHKVIRLRYDIECVNKRALNNRLVTMTAERHLSTALKIYPSTDLTSTSSPPARLIHFRSRIYVTLTLCACPSIYLCVSVCQFVCPSSRHCLCTYPSIHVSTYPSIHLSIYLNQFHSSSEFVSLKNRDILSMRRLEWQLSVRNGELS